MNKVHAIQMELTNVFYLGGSYAGSKKNHWLFGHMQEYIKANYETKHLKTVYIGGDCGGRIKAGDAERPVSSEYSVRIRLRPMGWSQEGEDAV